MRLVSVVALLSLAMVSVRGAGIPEPPVVLYGQVSTLVDGGRQRLTSGTLSGALYPSDQGLPIPVRTELTNVNDQYSYLLVLPCETVVGSISASGDALRMLSPPAIPITYTLGNLSADGQPAYLERPDLNPLWIVATNRGLLQRIDLTLDLRLVDSDGDGIPDEWEQQFGFDEFDPADSFLDPDLDGHTNLGEYVAGTNPTNAQSALAFTLVHADQLGGIRVEWSSASNRVYTLQRSADLYSGFVDIRTDLASTAPVNTYRDHTADDSGPYYFRLRIQGEPMPLHDGDGNGLPDAWEQLYFGRVRVDPNGDSDGDGESELGEYLTGTDPTDPTSRLTVLAVEPQPDGTIAVEWSSVVNKSYTLLWSSDPVVGYDVVASGLVATPPVNRVMSPALPPTGYYQVIVEQ